MKAEQMTIDEFIANETERLLEFAAKYKQMQETTAIKLPETLDNEAEWMRLYLSFLALKIRAGIIQNEKAA